jgi:hypothetical protein
VIEESDEDNPLVLRPSRSPPEPNLIPLGRHTIAAPSPAGEDNPSTDLPPESLLPLSSPIFQSLPHPTNGLPAYSAHLAHDELRIISTVHLDQNHPSAAFFSALASSSVHASTDAPPDPQAEQPGEWTTGGKKLRLSLTRGGQRMTGNESGPVYVKVGRSGVIEGRIEVGKVDHATSLEVAVSADSASLESADKADPRTG